MMDRTPDMADRSERARESSAKAKDGLNASAIAQLMNSPERFFNRELSWLKFNSRVLEEAENKRHPLLERLRFLSISASNLDEFYMVRVAGLRQQARSNITRPSQDGLTPQQQLDRIAVEAGALMAEQQRMWAEIRKEMRKAGLAVLDADDLSDADREWLRARFLERVFPVLTPLAIDPSHPFPFMPNQGFAVGFSLHRPGDGAKLSALVPIPTQVDRFMELPAHGQARRFISLENVITLFLDTLFPDCVSKGRCVLRVLRDSDIEVEEEAEDLVREFEILLKQRRRGRIVRLKIERRRTDRYRRSRRHHGDGAAQPAYRRRPARSRLPSLRAALPGADPRAWRGCVRLYPGEGHSRPPSL
jgi:polyphosphate kinase